MAHQHGAQAASQAVGGPANSHEAAIQRFDQAEVAGKYPARYGKTWKDRREVRSILRSLTAIPKGSHVLDLPCGTGRLLEVLLGAGYRVTCADCSEHMVRLAQRRWDEIRAEGRISAETPGFAVRDVMKTGYPDGHFDAVVCNRLFHHFIESDVRVRALRELARISKGPVVVSFFNALSIENVRLRLKHLFRGTVPRDRIPIPAWAFFNDLRRAGLTPMSAHGVLPGISPMWYVVSLPAAAGAFARRSHAKAG